ncbi:hypothetical protein G5714_024599 [Onychostoma macrolepis]|uniref:Uncharacterized protein n=1 Tax=Onychostoma macrolepis TaxID=369639 RepID=A0A7J6BHM6_9TELE|nr:hypothetical protein G5714_024599 [Onychostoma macrolepis]
MKPPTGDQDSGHRTSSGGGTWSDLSRFRNLYRNDWNPVQAEQQHKTDQLYYMTQCSREECQKNLARYNWDLQLAGRYIIRQDRDRDRTALDRRGERV